MGAVASDFAGCATGIAAFLRINKLNSIGGSQLLDAGIAQSL
jgi:hypothetical protein